ncbi:DNA oxidative demethylase ALKBH2-like [Argiope bruennichi]|uniref:DNA oxidative demethylase ALKBH2-like n=1 Tax=Argiope bruennichi TaxID=94029 RepID=UPI0024954778|nr:DNA oxidative demethylase ALKBH2-like [Argiope bruennichi]
MTEIYQISPRDDYEWQIITGENLMLRYAEIFSKSMSEFILTRLEEQIEYYDRNLSKVCVYGKWHEIPRKHVAFSDDGLSYEFSGNRIPSKPWQTSPIVFELKKCVESIVGHRYNFVLVNRYENGLDHIGEHRDDEKELDPAASIASLSFGAARDFVLKHAYGGGKKKIELRPGSLLLMEFPTNKFWYHSLPVRKKVSGKRINLTFRKMIV